MTHYLAMDVTNKLNIFPVKGGILDYYSPHVILGGRKLEYSKHLSVPFGAYVQVNQDHQITNTNAARKIDGIYLMANNNIQAGHWVMDLNTGRAIS